MAKELNQCQLEENGIITVFKYYRDEFTTSEKKDIVCSNCGKKRSHKHVYGLRDGKKVAICYFCNKKINNVNSLNSKFNKL
jgi:hypothetical protein